LWYDDASNRQTVGAVTRWLIVDDRVDLLIGPYSSVLTAVAAEVAWEHGKLLWNQGGASPNVYQRGNPWIVGVLTPATEYLAGLLSMVRQAAPGAESLAVLRAATGAFPCDVSGGVEGWAARMGFRTALARQFDAATWDFSEIIRAAGEARPDVLVGVGRFQNDLLLAEQLAASDVTVGAAVVVAAGVQQFHERLGPTADRFIGPSQWEPEVGYPADYGPSAQQVVASLRRAGQESVDYPMAQAYAVGVVAQRCLQEAGTTDDSALRQAAAALDFSTFYGRFNIDGTGRQIGRQALLVQWQRGRKVIVWPPELAQGDLVYPWR
jgi:branched-chain amino acid transport system substrate-binding protein